MNPLRRLFDLFRRKPPGMIGTPPSARQVPADPGLHAVDFSRRYFEPMDYHAGNRMTELGIAIDQIGSRDAARGIPHASFHPLERDGGGNTLGMRLNVDSGVFNPDLIKGEPGEEEWAKARLRDRLDAIIAHEYEEARRGRSHVEALRHAPDTLLPIREDARMLLQAMRGDLPETGR
jgi:hypothetical protein